MALKGSGVRASSAPLYYLHYFCAAFLLIFSIACTKSFAAPMHKSASTSATGKVDAVVFVFPGPNAARIVIAYNRVESHALVAQDISRLFRVSGWRPSSNIRITDASASAGDSKHFPITTAVDLMVSNAPQFMNGRPLVMPLLQALQRLNHIEIDYAIGSANGAANQEYYNSKALWVHRIEDKGRCSFDVVIKDHKGSLPDVDSMGTPLSNGSLPDVVGMGTTTVQMNTARRRSPFEETGISLLAIALLGFLLAIILFIRIRTVKKT